MFRHPITHVTPRPETVQVSTYRDDFVRLEGAWTGTEVVADTEPHYEAAGRLVFQTVFDGRFLLCDYVQTVRDRPPSVGHGVFRRDEHTKALSVTWFRNPDPTGSQQLNGVAEGDKMVFVETIDDRRTRTTYTLALDRLAIRAEASLRGAEWVTIFEGAYRRR
jgi:hypothetical protein